MVFLKGLMKPEEVQSMVHEISSFYITGNTKTPRAANGTGVTAHDLQSWRVALKRGIKGAGDEAMENMPENIDDRIGLVVFPAGLPGEVDVKSQDRRGMKRNG